MQDEELEVSAVELEEAVTMDEDDLSEDEDDEEDDDHDEVSYVVVVCKALFTKFTLNSVFGEPLISSIQDAWHFQADLPLEL